MDCPFLLRIINIDILAIAIIYNISKFNNKDSNYDKRTKKYIKPQILD